MREGKYRFATEHTENTELKQMVSELMWANHTLIH